MVYVVGRDDLLGQLVAARGDIIGALFAAAATEPDLANAVAEGQRRHREGARLAVERVAELGGLRDDVTPDRAAARIALSTTHEAWPELVDVHRLSWDDAEAWLEVRSPGP